MNTLFKRVEPTERKQGQPWSLEQAAEHIGVSIRTLTRMEKKGKIRFIREFNRRVLVPDSEVQRLAT